MSDIILRLSKSVPMPKTAQCSLRKVKRAHAVPSCLAKTRDLYHGTNVCSRLRTATYPFLSSTTNRHPSPQTKTKSPAQLIARPTNRSSSKTPTTPPRHTPKSANRRIHLQSLNIRIPLNRLYSPPDDQPQTRIRNNHKPKRHGDQPIQGTQRSRSLEHDFDARRVDDECSKRGAGQDAVEGRAVREHVFAEG